MANFNINQIYGTIDKFIEVNGIKHIYLDFDDTISNSTETVIKILNKRYGTNYKGEEVLGYYFENLFPVTERDIEDIFNSEEFFDEIVYINGGLEFVYKYRNIITIVTKASPANYRLKVELLHNLKLLKGLEVVRIPLTGTKGSVYMEEHSIFIDDCVSNLNDVLNSGSKTIPILFKLYNDERTRPWQMGWYKHCLTSW